MMFRIKTLLPFFLFAAATARGGPVVIAGKNTAVCGQGTEYRIDGVLPAAGFRWHLERGATGRPSDLWNGNAGHRFLTLAFFEGPGTYRLWVQEDGGPGSNCLEITALESDYAPTVRPPPPEAALATPLPAAPIVAAMDLAAAAQSPDSSFQRTAPVLAAALPPPPRRSASILRPNSEGVIDVTAAEPVPEIEPIPNPFRIRTVSAGGVREVPIAVSAVLASGGDGQGCSVINGRLLAVGDSVEGFTVSAVAAEAIELRNERATLLVPVQDKPLLLRLPR